MSGLFTRITVLRENDTYLPAYPAGSAGNARRYNQLDGNKRRKYRPKIFRNMDRVLFFQFIPINALHLKSFTPKYFYWVIQFYKRLWRYYKRKGKGSNIIFSMTQTTQTLPMKFFSSCTLTAILSISFHMKHCLGTHTMHGICAAVPLNPANIFILTNGEDASYYALCRVNGQTGAVTKIGDRGFYVYGYSRTACCGGLRRNWLWSILKTVLPWN
jgi:hypothetical protein